MGPGGDHLLSLWEILCITFEALVSTNLLLVDVEVVDVQRDAHSGVQNLVHVLNQGGTL